MFISLSGGPNIHRDYNIPKDITFDVNDKNSQISIVLQGNPQPNISWMLDGAELINTEVSVLDERKKLFNYTCQINVRRNLHKKFIHFTAEGYKNNQLTGGIKLNVTCKCRQLLYH